VGGCKEDYIVQCNRKKRSGLVWFQMGIWKLKGLRGGVERGTCSLSQCGENAIHTLLNCKETNRWREKYLNKKWLQMNNEVAFNKLVRCSRTNDLRQ
jgi:hypothetical protein